ncbi:MAG: DUF3108 domain-containing protein [Bacteroidia bacterium]|nr:DUF3108 domain-containing protein [Bacteroidia bacterium]
MKEAILNLARVILLTMAILFTGSFRAQENPNDEVFKLKNNKAFKKGEFLSYRLHYGVIDAGIATLEVTHEEREVSGRPTYHVVALGKSIGAFDWFFKVRDRYESYIDKEALVPMAFIRRVDEGGYKINQNYVYNHPRKQVISEGKVFDIPREINDVQDMISAFYYARALDYSKAKPGDVFTINSFVDNEIFPLKIKYIGKETINTSKGKFKCIKFRPVIQKGRIFKSEEDLNVWISDDENKIPVRAQANILVGSVKMDLMEYRGLANPLALVK